MNQINQTEDEEFEKVLDWANKEEQVRLTRGSSISSFKLIMGSLVILFLVFLVLYYSKHEKQNNYIALNMIKDPNNFFDDEFTENEQNEQNEIDEQNGQNGQNGQDGQDENEQNEGDEDIILGENKE
jgi:hypothetical protein